MLIVAASPYPVLVVAASLLLTVLVAAAMLVIRKRIERALQNLIVVRDGRPVLSDAARAKLDKSGLDIAQFEDFVAKKFTVNERGEIVKIRGGARAETPAPAVLSADASRPDPFTQAKPEPAGGADRFDSIWEQQDAGPSIWDEKDKTAFWGDAEKKK